MDKLTVLEKLYYSGEIDEKTFIKYYHKNEENEYILKELDRNRTIDKNIINTIETSSKIVSNRIKKINMDKNDSYFYRKETFIIIGVLENNFIVGITNESNQERILDYLTNRYFCKTVKFVKLDETLVNNRIKELLLDRKNSITDKIDNIPNFVENLILKSIDINASDIHIEPLEDCITIRIRVNGELNVFENVNKKYLSEVVTRLKVISNLDIAEKRDIQDGEFKISYKNEYYNFRISIIPTIYGEKIALRLLGSKTSIIDINNLEFGIHLNSFRQLINSNNGLVIVTGPTGSGKSTTLYSVLSYLNEENKNIMTVEDPVENKIEGITQIQINPKINFGFEKGLRAILRQDPDIIMIGEIRDKDTAINASRAAMTGHLVLSTLHTNSCIDAIDRLIDIGVEPYMVASSLKGIVSQRLVKILCPNCKEKYESRGFEREVLGVDIPLWLYKKSECSECHKGYIGRKSIYEVLIVNEEMKSKIRNLESIKNIKPESETNISSIENQCKKLIKEGIIELDEIYNIGVNQYG